jgi:hypothetical protein
MPALTASRPSTVTTVAAIAALALVWLAAGLPAGAFVSGDSGVKLIAALDAIAHPARPFDTDLPRVGTRTTTFVDPMVVPHGDHAHPLQSPLFPPLTAPLVAAFGLRGAYVWPALAFVALVPLLAAVRTRVLPETSWPLLAWIVVAANPVFLYALELWEHAPAVALLAAGTAVLAPSLVNGGKAPHVVAGGALLGAGVLLRPEGVWYAAGLALAVGPRLWLPLGGGVAALLLPAAALNYLHFGNPLGAHASAVLAPIGTDFLAARWQRVQDWLWPASIVETIGLALVAAAWIAALFDGQGRGPSGPLVHLRTRQLVALAGVATVAVLAARRALPAQAFLQGFPLVLLALVPSTHWPSGARRLGLTALVAAAGVVLTATNDGGAQWGTRYLLVAAPPLLLLAARGATEAAGEGAWRAPRVAALAVILLAGAMTSRSAYLELRGAKRNYDGLVATVASVVPPGGVIVTNAWWLDQVAAALHGTRTFLYVPDGPAASRALATIRAERLDDVTLAWSREASPFPLEAALDGTCFRVVASHDVPLRQVRLATARCSAGLRSSIISR